MALKSTPQSTNYSISDTSERIILKAVDAEETDIVIDTAALAEIAIQAQQSNKVVQVGEMDLSFQTHGERLRVGVIRSGVETALRCTISTHGDAKQLLRFAKAEVYCRESTADTEVQVYGSPDQTQVISRSSLNHSD